MSRIFRLPAGALVVVVALALTGCGKAELTGTPGKDITTLPVSTLPTKVGPLTVKAEVVDKALKKAKQSYVDAIGFYSLRNEEKRVQGTVQISSFGPSARLDDPDFRRQIVLGSSPGTPTTVNVSGTNVQQSTGTKSTVSIWFSEDRLVVLTVLKTYNGGRGLLEQTVVALPGS